MAQHKLAEISTLHDYKEVVKYTKNIEYVSFETCIYHIYIVFKHIYI